jgi:septum formation protein
VDNFIFTSDSKVKLELLKQINYVPNEIVLPNINEIPLKREKPKLYIERIARIKAEKVLKQYENSNILTIESIIVVRKKIIQSLKNIKEFEYFISLCSGRNVAYFSYIYLIRKDGIISKKLIETKVKFKHFSERDKKDIINFVKFDENVNLHNVCINGFCDCFVKKINGSYSNILGLPLYETRNIIISSIG